MKTIQLIRVAFLAATVTTRTYAIDPTLSICGDYTCQNGGTCVTSLVFSADGSTSEQQHCNCASTVTGTTIYAGPECEYEQTSFCTATSSMKNTLFCVNDGECQPDPRQGCKCSEGWTGFHCEHAIDTSSNGEDTPEEEEEEESIVECGDFYCHHGGQCTDSGDDYACDCSTAVSGDNFYAGPTCQYVSTAFCGTHDTQSFCVNGGSCSGNDADGNPLPCDCPSGWTGDQCEIAIDGDEHADQGEECGDGYCYNGGICTPTLLFDEDGSVIVEYHCDCSTAFTHSDVFAGPYCEHKATAVCSRPVDNDEGSSSLVGARFCTNGGTCPSNPFHGCDCPAAWTGASCEFEKEINELTEELSIQKEPESPVDGDRDNGSTETDNGDVDIPLPIDEEEEEEEDVPEYNDVTIECGDTVCHHGGTCLTEENEDDGTVQYSCDCSTAVTMTDLWAGEQCQFKSTTLCTQPSKGSEGSLIGLEFCVNGGTCPETSPGPCENCREGFYGQRCELFDKVEEEEEDDLEDTDEEEEPEKEAEICHLECQNGGTCANGILMSPFEDIIGTVDYLNKTQNDEDFEHCICPQGWAGLECQYQAQICGNNEHICYHGSTCTMNGNGEYTCDCSAANVTIFDDQEHAMFTGESCQHAATDVCVREGSFAYSSGQLVNESSYFCANQGRCYGYVSDLKTEEFPGCECPAGWGGTHCEVQVEIVPTKSKTEKYVLFGVAGFVVLGVVVAGAVLLRSEDGDERALLAASGAPAGAASKTPRRGSFFRRNRKNQAKTRPQESARPTSTAPVHASTVQFGVLPLATTSPTMAAFIASAETMVAETKYKDHSGSDGGSNGTSPLDSSSSDGDLDLEEQRHEEEKRSTPRRPYMVKRTMSSSSTSSQPRTPPRASIGDMPPQHSATTNNNNNNNSKRGSEAVLRNILAPDEEPFDDGFSFIDGVDGDENEISNVHRNDSMGSASIHTNTNENSANEPTTTGATTSSLDLGALQEKNGYSLERLMRQAYV